MQMVKVATTLDVPIKLLWTKSLTFSTSRGFTMLGLGDIVVPGMFVALALRYDQHRASLQGKPAGSWSKPYFYAALTAYVAGLVTTMTVMHVFHAAQPALLYLRFVRATYCYLIITHLPFISPACILSFVLTASARGELSDAWKWTEESPEDSRPRGSSNANASNHTESANTTSATTTALASSEDQVARKKAS